MYDMINDFVKTYKESVRSHLKRHDKSLHSMYEAINAISNMVGTHKDLMDSYKELFDTLSERIKLLEKSCQSKKE